MQGNILYSLCIGITTYTQPPNNRIQHLRQYNRMLLIHFIRILPLPPTSLPPPPLSPTIQIDTKVRNHLNLLLRPRKDSGTWYTPRSGHVGFSG